jgi:deoxyribonuclease-4
MRFGMHLSFRSGPRRAREIGCRALQVFCGNPRGWEKTPLQPEFVAQFRADTAAAGLDPLVVHATYLINLAAPNRRLYRLSREGFVLELERAAQLGARYYVIHCGTHMGAGVAVGHKRLVACVREGLERVPHAPMVLLENSAGGGRELGSTFEDLGELLRALPADRVGLCLDTCHALVAGYEMRTVEGVSVTLERLAQTVGLERLHCLHVNDSRGALGSHLDRHEHIGSGYIGVPGFRVLFADRRLQHLPAILETPKEGPYDDPDNLWRAIGIAVEVGALSAAEAGTRPERISPDTEYRKRKRAPKPLAKRRRGGKIAAVK